MPNTEEAIGNCTYCPRLCRSACPVETASGREALTPRAKMVMAGALTKKDAPDDAAEVLWGCSDCGACESMCLHGNPVGQTLYDARAQVTEAPAAMRGVRHRFELHGNPFGTRLSHDPLPDRKVTRAPLLVLGCHALHGDRALARKASELARRLHPDVQVPTLARSSGDEAVCCGRVLREAGEVAAYDRHRAELYARLSNADEVWVLEATCLDDFTSLRLPVPVRLFAEVLAASALQPLAKPKSITLHTGCGTHKHPRAEEALTALVQRASDDVRMPARELPFAGCCGGRGGIAEVMPAVAEEMAAGRQEELRHLHSEVTVGFSTCCNGRLAIKHVLDLYA